MNHVLLSKKYFNLAHQYYISSKTLLDIMIDNDNKSGGIGDTPEEADDDLKYNSERSDAELFIPSFLLCHHAVELYLKGLLILSNETFEMSHEVSNNLAKIDKKYDRDVKRIINKFYKYNIDILKEYKKDNKITNIKDLHKSLRYPENSKGIVDYIDLKYNGIKAVEQFERLERIMADINDTCWIEYRKRIIKE